MRTDAPPRRHLITLPEIGIFLTLWFVATGPAVETSGLFTALTANPSTVTSAILHPPTGVMATAIDDTSIDVSWALTAPPFNGSAAYDIYRSDEGGPYAFLAGVGPGTTFFPDGGLQPETTYSYVIRATFEQWSSVDSDPAAAMTEPTPDP